MPRQKRGFWLFILSLIPGAGEMYMGLFKQGISIMLLFWATIAAASSLNLEFLVFLLPVIWFYSFLHVHNLKDLPAEEFYAIEDNYLIDINSLWRKSSNLSPRFRKIYSLVFIALGVIILWNGLGDMLYDLLPARLAYIVAATFYRVPQMIVAVLIIVIGCLIMQKKDVPSQGTQNRAASAPILPPVSAPADAPQSQEPADTPHEENR